jgi:competence protein ComEC
MPRSGWLAIGTVVAALGLPAIVERLGPGADLALAIVLASVGATVAAVGRTWGTTRPASLARRAVVPMAVGGFIVAVRLLAGGPPPTDPVVPDGAGPWQARVVGVGSPRAGQQTATLQIEPGGLRVAATLPRYPEIVPGDRVVAGGRLEPLPADDGGYGTYLRRVGAAATLRSRSLERVGRDEGPASAIEAARRASGEALTRSLPEPEAGLAAGIIIGLRDRVDRDLAAAFTTAGVSHVVAISGWNIAIVGSLIGALIRGRMGRRGRSLVTLLAIVAYTLAAGASPSVVRAAAMAAVVLLARESGRSGAAATALGWAVVLLLVADPRTVSDAGFQLSVLATGGLIAWATPITGRLRAWRGGRLPGWLAESLGVSFAAEAATLPLVLAGFGRFALLAPAVNLVVVPLVPVAMAVGTVALIGGWLAQAGVPAIVGVILGLPGWLILAVLVIVVRVAAALPFASITLAQPWATVAGVGAALAVLGAATAGRRLRIPGRGGRRPRRAPEPTQPPRSTIAPRPGSAVRLDRRRSVRFLAGSLALSLVVVLVAAANRPDGQVRVTVLDVGQGDAILVEGGRGGRLLVDGGPDPDRLLVALDARLPPWDRRIDLLVLTHPHEDHVAGLALLLHRYRIGRTFEPGMIGPGPGYRAWQAALRGLGLQPDRLATGDAFGLDQIRFHVLWPDSGKVPSEPPDGGTAINNVSIVLLGEVGRERFLLAGDIEEGVDPILLARGLPHVELLKIAHHGSRTSSSGPFLDAVRPRVAIASAGSGNPYGHPTRATLDRVAARGATVLRTDLNGSVEVTLDGLDRLDVRPDRAIAAAPPAPATGASVDVARLAFTCAIPPPRRAGPVSSG